MKKIDISVVIPTYNGELYLKEAIESVYGQQHQPREILVVDDVSSDNTCDTIESLARTSPIPIRLLRLEKNTGGPVGPMNRGIEAAKGEIIAMLDQDDVMCPRKLITQARPILEQNDLNLAFGRVQRMSAEGRLQPLRLENYTVVHETASWPLGRDEHYGVLTADDAYRLLLDVGFNYGGAGGMVFRKSLWEELNGFDERFRICWDFDFALRATSSGASVGYVPETVYWHRRHASNLEASGSGASLFEEQLCALESQRGSVRSISDQRRLSRVISRKTLNTVYFHRQRGNFQRASELLRQLKATQGWTSRLWIESIKNYVRWR